MNGLIEGLRISLVVQHLSSTYKTLDFIFSTEKGNLGAGAQKEWM